MTAGCSAFHHCGTTPTNLPPSLFAPAGVSGDHMRSMTIRVRFLKIVRQPVSREVDTDLAIVDMRVLGAAFFGCKYLYSLIFGANRVKKLLRVFDRNDAVVASVCHKKRALDVFGHVLERELLGDLDAAVFVVGVVGGISARTAATTSATKDGRSQQDK